MEGFVKIAKSDEIQPGQGKMVEVDGKKIALFTALRSVDPGPAAAAVRARSLPGRRGHLLPPHRRSAARGRGRAGRAGRRHSALNILSGPQGSSRETLERYRECPGGEVEPITGDVNTGQHIPDGLCLRGS
jgi:hypothetical protein